MPQEVAQHGLSVCVPPVLRVFLRARGPSSRTLFPPRSLETSCSPETYCPIPRAAYPNLFSTLQTECGVCFYVKVTEPLGVHFALESVQDLLLYSRKKTVDPRPYLRDWY